MHTLFYPDLDPDCSTLVVEGDEAKHAVRVKRIMVGDQLRILDGNGTAALARVDDTQKRLALTILKREVAAKVSPAIDVWSATPKGPRVADLVDQLVQVGAASWTPMTTKLGVVDPRESKLARLERVALEAAKQAQRPWLMELREKDMFASALRATAGTLVVMADQEGEPYARSGAKSIRVLVGPEGGFTDDERAAARRAGVRMVSVSPHTLRIEVAAPVAVAVILHTERQEAATTASLVGP